MRLFTETFGSGVARSALPDAPVQPYKPRRRIGRRRRAARDGLVPPYPGSETRAGRSDGEGDLADDRRPARRQPHDGLQRLLSARPAVRRTARPDPHGGPGARLRRPRPDGASTRQGHHRCRRRAPHGLAAHRLHRSGGHRVPRRRRRRAGPDRTGPHPADVGRSAGCRRARSGRGDRWSRRLLVQCRVTGTRLAAPSQPAPRVRRSGPAAQASPASTSTTGAGRVPPLSISSISDIIESASSTPRSTVRSASSTIR